jgi:hypothetical protein
MNTFAIQGRCIVAPPPADWRDQLAQRLGAKPRRIGTWAELGLYGALRCMADAGETTLPQDAQIWLGSRRGTYAATAAVLEQLRDDLPMPLAFLQTQPSQMLALLAAQLEWKGHACFVAGGDPQGLLRLAAAESHQGGILLGWVDDMDGGSTNWLRLRPSVAGDLAPLASDKVFSQGHSLLRIDAEGLRGCLAGQANLGESGAG